MGSYLTRGNINSCEKIVGNVCEPVMGKESVSAPTRLPPLKNKRLLVGRPHPHPHPHPHRRSSCRSSCRSCVVVVYVVCLSPRPRMPIQRRASGSEIAALFGQCTLTEQKSVRVVQVGCNRA
ncbi:hypothetical protein M0802_000363 [Mischocyttarus mexicanus]|nr:hypothetical protein M0802_000363 [Mischocyttarus mexicanus]